MIFILGLYLGTVYLIFVKWKLLPVNGITTGLAALVGVVIMELFLVGLQTLTPASTSGMITAPITEISSQVQGQVIEVPVAVNQAVEANEILFKINPRSYQDTVDQLTAQLVTTSSNVAQLKEALDAARAQVRSTVVQLTLGQTRLAQLEELLATGAGTQFDVQNKATEVASLEQGLLAAQATENQAALALNARVGGRQSQIAQVLAQLDVAQFNLENCEVRAPANGMVAMNLLRPGMVISPGRAVMTFVYSDTLRVMGLFPQKGLRHLDLGDRAMITFPALPGHVFESKIRLIPGAIGNAQLVASGQLVASAKAT